MDLKHSSAIVSYLHPSMFDQVVALATTYHLKVLSK
jgi:hypothetical protein